MLMNYLYANFREEAVFVKANETTRGRLAALTDAGVFPAPSYVFTSKGLSVSFVSNYSEDANYRFHLKGHSAWFESVVQHGIISEEDARQLFFSRYDDAKKMFFASDLGQGLSDVAPVVRMRFCNGHATLTWNHFLKGVYGVCTRDGQPGSVFRKQALVMFVEHMTAKTSAPLSGTQLHLLERAVVSLDEVESDFAPHEVSQTSRQHCIIDVRANLLNTPAP